MLIVEEHGVRIKTKYNQLVSNLSCLGDIIAMMYQKEKLTLKELEHIQHLQSTPIRANEELLSIIARKPRDVYECFLALVKNTKQLHLYQTLLSGDDSKYNKHATDLHIYILRGVKIPKLRVLKYNSVQTLPNGRYSKTNENLLKNISVFRPQ